MQNVGCRTRVPLPCGPWAAWLWVRVVGVRTVLPFLCTLLLTVKFSTTLGNSPVRDLSPGHRMMGCAGKRMPGYTPFSSGRSL